MRKSLMWIGLFVVAGCNSPPVSRERVQEVEHRFLAPLLTGAEVGCNELLVEMTGNFNPYVSQPARDPRAHTFRREAGDGFTEMIWTNTLGRPQASFVVTIGEPGEMTPGGMMRGQSTKFTVMNQVRVRVYEGRHAVTLKVHAGGELVVVRQANGAGSRDVREFVVEDGVQKAP